MKFLILITLFVGVVQPVNAQSLDVGGIELKLGQKVDDALRSLSNYQVQYVGSSWFVSQETGNRSRFLGVIAATNNEISFIRKSFAIDGNESAVEVYSQASKELRTRGGTACFTREAIFSDGVINGFDTRCGKYELSYTMPWKDGTGNRILSGVSISIRSK